MKARLLFFITIFFYLQVESFATIRRVNNTGITTASPPNASVIYTTAQAAHDAAMSGDTIHIEPSGVSYGNLYITKKLTVIGNGYFLGTPSSNGNPNLQANSAPSKVNNVYIGGSAANNTEIMGMTIESNLWLGYDATSGAVGVSGVIIRRNNISSTTFYGLCSNIVFIQNYSGGVEAATASVPNFLLAHNILGIVNFNNNDSGILQNNLCTNYVNCHNSTIRNNVFSNLPFSNFTSSSVENNIANNTTIGTTNGNQSSVVMTTVFEDWPDTSMLWSEDSRFTLKSGSPALGAGYGGADIGPIVNVSNTNNNLAINYRLSGIPAVPSIYKFDAPSVVNTGTINVTISTRSNN